MFCTCNYFASHVFWTPFATHSSNSWSRSFTVNGEHCVTFSEWGALENMPVWPWAFVFTIMMFEWTHCVLKVVGKLWAYVSSYPFVAVLSSSYLFMIVYHSGLSWRNYASRDVTQVILLAWDSLRETMRSVTYYWGCGFDSHTLYRVWTLVVIYPSPSLLT